VGAAHTVPAALHRGTAVQSVLLGSMTKGVHGRAARPGASLCVHPPHLQQRQCGLTAGVAHTVREHGMPWVRLVAACCHVCGDASMARTAPHASQSCVGWLRRNGCGISSLVAREAHSLVGLHLQPQHLVELAHRAWQLQHLHTQRLSPQAGSAGTGC
jgi:hypothetical protein